jgi:hypothetical protein
MSSVDYYKGFLLTPIKEDYRGTSTSSASTTSWTIKAFSRDAEKAIEKLSTPFYRYKRDAKKAIDSVI